MKFFTERLKKSDQFCLKFLSTLDICWQTFWREFWASFSKFRKMSTSVDLSSYRDQHFKGSRNEQERLLKNSTTLYVGNLSFFTTEEQLYELFGKCGDVKRIIMGLEKFKRTPCGFCFVEYYLREDAENAQRYINGTRYEFFCVFESIRLSLIFDAILQFCFEKPKIIEL